MDLDLVTGQRSLPRRLVRHERWIISSEEVWGFLCMNFHSIGGFTFHLSS
jgi:hypothetical protein